MTRPVSPTTRLFRKRAIARAPWLLAGLFGLLLGGAVAGTVPAAEPADDDPFADELNPFGRQPKPPVSEPVKPDADAGRGVTPPPRLPVPFPETGQPADDRDRGRQRDLDRDRPRATPRRYDGDFSPEPRDGYESSPAEALLAEAEQLDRTGDLEAARTKLRAAINLDPKLTIAHLALGVVSRRLGDFEGCVDACSQGLAIDPQDAELFLRRGIAWFHLGLHGIALEDFEDAAGIAYDDPRPELWRGLTLMELDRPLEAINAYAAAIRRDRTFMLAYLNRGLAYLRTEQPRKAEFDFDQAIRHDPKDVRAWFNRGVAQAQQGKFAAAANSYGEALKRDPGFEPARRNLKAVRDGTQR